MKNKIKIKLSLLYTSFILLLNNFLLVKADLKYNPGPDTVDYEEIENSFLNNTWMIVFGIAVIAVAIAGISFMSAGSNPHKREAAKNRLITAVIALALLGGFKLIIGIAVKLFN